MDATEHRLELTPNMKPVHQPAYMAGPSTCAVIHREISKLHAAGIVEPANMEWASPVVFALSKVGSLRFCIDYGRLKAITILDAYPIPRIDDCLDSLGGAKIVFTLD